MSKSIEQIKAAFKYEKEKMHKRLQIKEDSLKAHILEMDRLRKENNKLNIMSKKLYTLEEAKDLVLGKIGTYNRDNYEKELLGELQTINTEQHDPNCNLCHGSGKYSFSTFGGETTTIHTCFCKRKTAP